MSLKSGKETDLPLSSSLYQHRAEPGNQLALCQCWKKTCDILGENMPMQSVILSLTSNYKNLFPKEYDLHVRSADDAHWTNYIPEANMLWRSLLIVTESQRQPSLDTWGRWQLKTIFGLERCRPLWLESSVIAVHDQVAADGYVSVKRWYPLEIV